MEAERTDFRKALADNKALARHREVEQQDEIETLRDERDELLQRLRMTERQLARLRQPVVCCSQPARFLWLAVHRHLLAMPLVPQQCRHAQASVQEGAPKEARGVQTDKVYIYSKPPDLAPKRPAARAAVEPRPSVSRIDVRAPSRQVAGAQPASQRSDSASSGSDSESDGDTASTSVNARARGTSEHRVRCCIGYRCMLGTQGPFFSRLRTSLEVQAQAKPPERQPHSEKNKKKREKAAQAIEEMEESSEDESIPGTELSSGSEEAEDAASSQASDDGSSEVSDSAQRADLEAAAMAKAKRKEERDAERLQRYSHAAVTLP